MDIPIVGESRFAQFDAAGTDKRFPTKSQNLAKPKRTKREGDGRLAEGSASATAAAPMALYSSRVNVIKPTSELQVVGLDTDTPLVKLSNNADVANLSSTSIDGKIYRGEWRPLVGTDMVFNDTGELVGTVREHIYCDDANVLVPRETGDEDEIEEEDAEETDLGANLSALRRRLYAMAKRAENDTAPAATPAATERAPAATPDAAERAPAATPDAMDERG